jgi:GcrA cell cycle regulator
MERRMSWTDERVELLKKLWTDGLSASQIAAELGGVTRNAVIGKVHRLGLSGRTKTTRPSAPRVRKARRPSMPPRPTTRVIGNTALKINVAADEDLDEEIAPVRSMATVEELFIPPEERATILQLSEHTCKWPIGDPGQDDFYFCGRRSDAGVPYCEHHCRVAYQPASDRRRKSSN